VGGARRRDRRAGRLRDDQRQHPAADGRRSGRPYYLWKLLIGHQFQGRGYGAATLDAVVGYLATRPGADVLYTSCADGAGSPRGFYLRYGFTDTGRVMWGENVLALDLTARG
jgi:diamine N-acetyltransferase